MITFYITGTSQGIGKAIAEQALLIDDSVVYGFSRTSTINHKNYKHITIDLSLIDEIYYYQFYLYIVQVLPSPKGL